MDYWANIVEAVKFLEANPKLKEDMRAKGMKYIFDTFHIEKIGPRWLEFINRF
jgi:hypothetical protein